MCTEAIDHVWETGAASVLGFVWWFSVWLVPCFILLFLTLASYFEFLTNTDSAALITLFRCVGSLMTGYSLASPYSACLLELAFSLTCSILFMSNIPTWYLLECLVYSGKERQRGISESLGSALQH